MKMSACSAFCLAALASAASAADGGGVRFEKLTLTDRYFCDGIAAGDFNRDGHMDVVAGPYWHAGPAFTERHAFYPPQEFEREPSPTDSMFSYVHDFNRDGWPDILVLGRVHKHEAVWRENPKNAPGHWKAHPVFFRIRGESPPFTDADGDGRPELVAHWENQWGLIQPHWDRPASPWTFRPITERREWPQFYHGEGVGDINGDGRSDLILNEGWYEQPADQDALWIRHEFEFGERGGAQMEAYDVDGDGDNDVITALDAHGWGLAWFEQIRDGAAISFRKHPIMGSRDEETRFGVAFSQPHALALADIDGDGLKDIVTGKRMWAHGPSGDVEPNAAPVNYWFQLERTPGNPPVFIPRLIDDASGLGVQITVTDVNADRRPDVLTASKLGSFVFLNRSVDAPDSASMAFPGKDWEEASPESQGMSSAALEAAVDFLKDNAGSDGVKQLVVVRNGRILWKGSEAARRHGVWSCTKSFTSTALGLLIQDGRCHLDSKAAEFEPKLAETYGEATLRHFAAMTSGYRAENDEPRGGYTHGPSSTPFDPSSSPLFTPPGSRYAYWDSAMNMFALVLTRAAEEPLESLFRRRVADPIGMNPEAWDWGEHDAIEGLAVNGGAGNAGKHVQISALEFARLGHLFLNRGEWNGRRVLDAAWVKAVSQVQVPPDLPLGHPESGIDGRGCYGLNWWVNGLTADGARKWPGAPAGTFAASGYNNNDLFVIPEWRMVIVRLGLDEDERPITDAIYAAFLKRVGAAFRQDAPRL